MIADAPIPFRVLDGLPGLLQEDPFVQRFTAGVDEVLAPVFLTLDNIEAYFDPATAPADFVAWLASWVGLALDDSWPLDRRRTLVAGAAELFRWRGTARALTAHVALYTGTDPEIDEGGGVAVSEAPGAALPGDAQGVLVVRVRVADPDAIDVRRLDRIVALSKPAHVPHRVEVVAP